MINFLLNKRILVLSIGAAAMAIVVVLYFISSNTRTNNTEPSEPITSISSPIKKTVIGVTKEEDLAGLDIIESTTLPSGETQHLITSELISRPDEIITKEGVVVYERVLLPENPTENGYETFSSIELGFGTPDLVLEGSDFYGWNIESRIYSSKGFTAIGNPNTGEIYELQFYEPMPAEEYVNLYGEDINTELGPHEHEEP